MKAIDIVWDVDHEDEQSLLPVEIEIPNGLTDEEEISDYLSQVTGFCHKGFVLVESENPEHTFYHVTLLENVPSISKNGLIPQIGERSEEFGEQEKGVFLFPSEDDMNNALMNWLGEWYNDAYGEDCKLAVLHVHLPDEIQVCDSEAAYEKICTSVIPPEYISFFDEQGNEILISELRQEKRTLAGNGRAAQSVPVFNAELRIDQKEIERIKTLMDMAGAQIYDRYGLKRDETITHTLHFENGAEIDVKVVICDEDEKPYIDIVLFDKHGNKIACDVGESSIEGEYSFETKAGIYNGVIQAKEQELQKPVSALDEMLEKAEQQGKNIAHDCAIQRSPQNTPADKILNARTHNGR